ncbi:MAG TPA: rRNA adenine N-6-methyltransferase family protein [Bacteroidia bacterium]|nr:rRNA adenine N-6-methyltransferase family protein [Bacteroidia bacterium]
MAPSSPQLIKKMLDEIDFSGVEVIVEYGIGDGCFTEEILRRMNPTSKLICFEVDHDCCELVRGKLKDERLVLLETGAEHVTEELHKLNIRSADVVVSSLPLAVIDKSIVKRILSQSVKLLSKGKLYLQYQYSLTSFKDIKSYFSSVKRKVEIINIPPAVIYICSN